MSGYGLMQMSQNIKSNAMGGLRDAANLEQQRNNTNEQLRQAKKQAETSAMGSGAAMGAMLGAQYGTVGGPMGMAIGAGIGLLGGYLLS